MLLNRTHSIQRIPLSRFHSGIKDAVGFKSKSVSNLSSAIAEKKFCGIFARYFGSKKPKEKHVKKEELKIRKLKHFIVDDEEFHYAQKKRACENYLGTEEIPIDQADIENTELKDIDIKNYEHKIDQELSELLEKLSFKAEKFDKSILERISISIKDKIIFLPEVSQIVVRSQHVIIINMFDKSHTQKVIHALRQYHNSWNPQEESSGVIKLQLPKMTQEDIEQMKKKARQCLEQTKIEIRKHRQRARDDIKLKIQDSSWRIVATNNLQTIIDKKIKIAEKMLEEKIKELCRI